MAGFLNLIAALAPVALKGVRDLGFVPDADQRCWAFGVR